ncbi:MAG: phosphohistidine phosphatase SixA [Phycisphaerales bacterium]|nr:MAG: phosphohistidine phosphatase SixA [Phycisphaerales bacterium]
MRLYLVQHGDAVAKDVDPDRPLSEKGRADVERIAAFLSRAGVIVSELQHSGKTRAQQTAELLASAIGTGASCRSIAGIAPLDPVADFARIARDLASDTMVVGHLPFMGKLVSCLVLDDESTPCVAFQPGTVVCLERADGGDWSVAWMIRPELLGGLGGY